MRVLRAAYVCAGVAGCWACVDAPRTGFGARVRRLRQKRVNGN